MDSGFCAPPGALCKTKGSWPFSSNHFGARAHPLRQRSEIADRVGLQTRLASRGTNPIITSKPALLRDAVENLVESIVQRAASVEHHAAKTQQVSLFHQTLIQEFVCWCWCRG